MDKLERMLNLTAALLETERPLTAAQIRKRVPGYSPNDVNFRRAFERDKEDLREMGIPVATEDVVGDAASKKTAQVGYRIHKGDYYLGDPGLEADELAALHLAASTVRLEGAGGAEALWKLGGAPAEPGAPQVGELAALPLDGHLGPLFGAVAERRTVSFGYSEVDRQVDPYRLDYSRGHWYLSGYDHVRDALRYYRVDRIAAPLEVGDRDAFERPAEQPPGLADRPWELGEASEAMVANLLVDAAQAPWGVQYLGESSVAERRDDGSIRFEVEVVDVGAFRSLVLSFLDHAEILGPPELRADMVQWLRTMVVAEDTR